MATQDDYIRTALRVPPGLHAQIHEAARANNRTFNAEIVDRLQATFDEAVVTTVEGHVQSAEKRRFEFNADAIAAKVIERLEGRSISDPDKVFVIGNLGRLPDFGAQQADGERKLRGNEPHGPKKSPNARRGGKT